VRRRIDVSGTEPVTDECLRGYGEGVEGEGGQTPHAVEHLVPGEVHSPEARRDEDREQDGEPQREGPDEEGYPGAGVGEDPTGGGAQRGTGCSCSADHDDREHGAHRQLGGGGPRSRSGDAEPEPVDERDVEDRVGHGPADRHVQRRAGVLEAAQHACRREDHEHPGEAWARPAQIGHRVPGDGAVGTHRANRPGGGEPQRRREDDTETCGQPHAVDTGLERLGAVACTDPAGDRGRRRVGEEHAQPDEGQQDRRRNREPREVRRPQVADDRGVDEDEDRLGDERPESGHGEREDLTVEGTTGSAVLTGRSTVRHVVPPRVEAWICGQRIFSSTGRSAEFRG
jgi:hypothetical protein